MLSQKQTLSNAEQVPTLKDIHHYMLVANSPDNLFILHSGRVCFDFIYPASAEQFLEKLKTSPVLKALEFDSASVVKVAHKKQYMLQASHRIQMNPTQFEAIFGQGSYVQLAQLHGLMVDGKLVKMAEEMCKLDATMANLAALLIDNEDGWSGLHVVAEAVKDERFNTFIGRLTQPVLDTTCHLQNEFKDNPLHIATEFQPGKNLLCLMGQITPQRFQEVSCQVNNKGCNPLRAVITHQEVGVILSYARNLRSVYLLKAVEQEKDGLNAYHALITKKKSAALIPLLELTATTFDDLFTRQNSVGKNLFQVLLDIPELESEALLFLLEKASNEAVQTAASHIQAGTSLHMQLLTSEREDVSQAFSARLKPVALKQADLTKYLTRWASKNPQSLPSFIEQLSPESFAECALALSNDRSTLTLLARTLSESLFLQLLTKLYQHPSAVKQVLTKVNYLRSIEFYDGGGSEDAWSDLTKAVIQKTPIPKKRKMEGDVSRQIDASKRLRPTWKPDFLQRARTLGLQFLRLQGRTILLQDKEGMILAVKVQKEGEMPTELRKEFDTTGYLKENTARLNLKSTLPTPLSLTNLNEVGDWLKPYVSAEELAAFNKMIGQDKKRMAYVYKVNPKECDYFTYLHDATLSDQAFRETNRTVVHDLYTLLGRGVVFTQLADIFHNSEHVEDRDDRGRYIVLVNLIRARTGSGRLTGWKQAVKYPNLRHSGLADLGDRQSINQFIGKTEYTEKLYSAATSNHPQHSGNYILANVIAEYQYVLFLIAGCRGCSLTEQARLETGKSAEEITAKIKAIWLTLAKQIVSNCALAIATLSQQKEAEAEAFLLAVVDVNRLARQMQYWMTDEYVPDLLKNTIPPDIYGENLDIEVKIDGFRQGTFNSKIGCAIDGVNPDLGAVNGQEPIKKANELFYWMVTSLFKNYQQMQLALTEFIKIKREDDHAKANELRQKAFRYLPPKAYHAIQVATCEERLARQSTVMSIAMREDLNTARDIHKREHAALIISGFWRSKRDNRQEKEAPLEEANSTNSAQTH